MKREDKSPDEPKPLKAALDRLYCAPPTDFTALRKELADALREEGHPDLAKRVLAARKPDRAAWALNRKVLDDDTLVRAALDAFDAAAAEQSGGDAAKWKRALLSYRERLTALTHAIRDELAEEGGAADAALLRRLAQTVQAAAADPEERDRLLAGRIEKSIEASDSLAGLGAPAPDHHEDPQSERRLRTVPPPPPSSRRTFVEPADRAKEAAHERERKREERERAKREAAEKKERERAIKEARAALAAAQAHERKVEAELERTQKEVTRARDALTALLDED